MTDRRRSIMFSFKRSMSVFIVIMLFAVSGCRSTGLIYHINEDVDFSFIKRVAVMPLENFTKEKSASESVRQIVISELLATGLVEVVVPGEVRNAVNRLNIKSIESPNEKEIQALGKTLKVEALIMGSLGQYEIVRSGTTPAPEVTITLMMADTGSGNIIWSVTNTHGGASFMARHFGADSMTMSETVVAVVRESIQTLFAY